MSKALKICVICFFAINISALPLEADAYTVKVTNKSNPASISAKHSTIRVALDSYAWIELQAGQSHTFDTGGALCPYRLNYQVQGTTVMIDRYGNTQYIETWSSGDMLHLSGAALVPACWNSKWIFDGEWKPE
jgi:hypothetical protein